MNHYIPTALAVRVASPARIPPSLYTNRQPKYVSWLTCILAIIGIVWSLWNLDPLKNLTPEEKEYQWQIISRMNHGAVMPEIRPKRPNPEAILKFYKEKVDPIWKESLKEKGKYFFEDYYIDLQKVLEIHKNDLIPWMSHYYYCGAGSSWEAAMFLAAHNGWREKLNYETELLFSKNFCKKREGYMRWYELSTAIDDIQVDWTKLIRWILTTYFNGLFTSLLIFFLRITGDPLTSLRSELGIYPLRFFRIVTGWPIYIWFYPYQTQTAIELKKIRLEAEYRRDKPLGYKLSREENAWIEHLAQQPLLGLKQILAAIRSSQDEKQKKSLSLVYLTMLFWLLFAPLAKAQAMDNVPKEPTKICQYFSEIMNRVRNGPELRSRPGLEDHQDQSFDSQFGLIPAIIEWLTPIIWQKFWEVETEPPPGQTPLVFHVPRPSYCSIDC